MDTCKSSLLNYLETNIYLIFIKMIFQIAGTYILTIYKDNYPVKSFKIIKL